MPIYDWNGSAATEIGKAYDWNGTAATQIGKVYDWNGTTSSLIYQAPSISDITITPSGSPEKASGEKYFYSAVIDVSGFSTITFKAINNNARVEYLSNPGTVNSCSSMYGIYYSTDASGNSPKLSMSSNFGVKQTIDIANIQKLQFRCKLEWNISTTAYSVFAGNWTITDIILS